MAMDEYQAVFEVSPDGILVVDERGVIVAVNPMASRLFGWGREELEGQTVEALVPEGSRGAHVDHRSQFVHSPSTRPMGIGMELRGVRRDGSEFPVEISLSPWRSEAGPRVIVTVRDVTQRKRLRDFSAGALRASEEERRRIARELHDDTAQQLATLLLRLRLVERDLPDPRWRERLEELRGEVASCAEGVRRIARGLRPPELQDAGLVAALRAHVRAIREGTGLDITLEAEPVDELLDTEACLVLYRIVQEAVSNAVRHASTDVVHIRVARWGDGVLGEVRDEGRGFATPEEGREGGGLGLLGMQERAVMAGGRVTVRSEPGRGTTVRVELPGSKDEDD